MAEEVGARDTGPVALAPLFQNPHPWFFEPRQVCKATSLADVGENTGPDSQTDKRGSGSRQIGAFNVPTTTAVHIAFFGAGPWPGQCGHGLTDLLKIRILSALHPCAVAASFKPLD